MSDGTDPSVVARSPAPLDVLVGLAVGAAQAAGAAAGTAYGIARPFVEFALRPPLLPRRYWPQTTIDALADYGRSVRDDAEQRASTLADSLVPTVAGAVLERIDLAAIANQIVDDIDLPEIIRESSGAMASESVVGVRMRGIEADEKVSQLVDRLLLRRARTSDEPPDLPAR